MAEFLGTPGSSGWVGSVRMAPWSSPRVRTSPPRSGSSIRGLRSRRSRRLQGATGRRRPSVPTGMSCTRADMPASYAHGTPRAVASWGASLRSRVRRSDTSIGCGASTFRRTVRDRGVRIGADDQGHGCRHGEPLSTLRFRPGEGPGAPGPARDLRRHLVGGVLARRFPARHSESGRYSPSLDPHEGELVARLSGHDAAVDYLAFDPDGTKLLTGSDDGTARIWAVPNGTLLLKLEGQPRE